MEGFLCTLLNSCFQSIIIVAEHPIFDEAGFLNSPSESVYSECLYYFALSLLFLFLKLRLFRLKYYYEDCFLYEKQTIPGKFKAFLRHVGACDDFLNFWYKDIF